MFEGPAMAIVVIGGTFLTTTVAATVAWLRARERLIRAEERLAARGGSDGGAGRGELTDVMRALDAIAIEVERISEGQRYVSSLVGGRELRAVTPRNGLPARPAGPHNTPS